MAHFEVRVLGAHVDKALKDKDLYESLDAIYASTPHQEEFVRIIYQLCFRTHEDRRVFRNWLNNHKEERK